MTSGRTVGPNGKNPPKIRLKKSGDLLILIMPATVWQILNLKCMQWPETEIMLYNFKKIVKSNEVN